jgi:hypothetical protein
MSHSDDDIDRRNARTPPPTTESYSLFTLAADDFYQASYDYGYDAADARDLSESGANLTAAGQRLDALIERAERIEEQLAFVAYCGNGHRYSDHEWTAIERALAPIDAEPP